jgi:hypothetical protein
MGGFGFAPLSRRSTMDDRVYLTLRQADVEAENDWYKHCTSKSQPHVILRVRARFSEIGYDCHAVSVGRDCAFGSDGTILDDLKKVVQRSGGKFRSATTSVGVIGNIPHDNAREAAAAVFQLLNSRVSASRV